MKRILTLVVCCCFLSSLYAQEIEKAPVAQEIQRSNVFLLNGMFSASKIGFGLKYKSLYEIRKSLHVGWGVGIESFSSGVKRNFIPLSFDVVGDLFDQGRTPFYMLSVGYGVPLNEDPSFAMESKGGLMLDAAIGYRVKKEATHSFISFGYRMQNATYLGTDDYGNTDKKVVYKRWSLSVGTFF